ncbi:MAG: NADH-quinone oxidoreductase subunit J [Planctomycetaceae bacterium]|nr:NADH-quinone oxidoreductase subunit J [Planctomycetaceae bacterium]
MLLAAIDWHALLFLLFALVACGFGAAVLLTSNVVRMAFYLTLCLGATSGLFFLAGAQFVGAMQLMIYVGGTLVLLIFGVMLTAQARFISMKTGAGEWILGAIVGSSLLLLLVRAGFSVESWRLPRLDRDKITLAEGQTSTAIGLALTSVRVDKLSAPNEKLKPGMSGYLLPFVIVSMHLLVVLIGAGYMARTKRLGVNRATDRPVAQAPPRDRDRSFFVSAGLASGMIVNLLLAVGCCWLVAKPLAITGNAAPTNQFLLQLAKAIDAAPSWLLPTLGLLFLANVLLLVVVWYWQKWGVVGLVIVPLVMAFLIASTSLGQAAAVTIALIALAPVVLLILLLCSGRPTAWSQME